MCRWIASSIRWSRCDETPTDSGVDPGEVLLGDRARSPEHQESSG
jgi:hypothetical protein